MGNAFRVSGCYASDALTAIDGALAEARPSEPQHVRIEQLAEETGQAEDAFAQLMESRVQPINEMMQAMPQVVLGEDD